MRSLEDNNKLYNLKLKRNDDSDAFVCTRISCNSGFSKNAVNSKQSLLADLFFNHENGDSASLLNADKLLSDCMSSRPRG
jgi:hypothetical protein